MPKTIIVPPGTTKPIAPFSPGTMADGIVYVSGTLAFDKDNNVITHLGYDPEWTKQVLGNNFKMRGTPKDWKAGRFIHPHDTCFDRAGNIFVVEWVEVGRVSKLRKVT